MLQPFKKTKQTLKSRLRKTKRSSSPFSLALKLLGFMVVVLGVATAYYLAGTPQEIRQEASTGRCAYEEVNVQFRRYVANADNPWVSGTDMGVLNTGDRIDVNCFANTGRSNLPGGSFTVAKDGKVVTLPASVLQSSTQIKGLTINEAGSYAFTCSNTTSCSNTDTVVVRQAPGTSPSPSPSASVAPTTPPVSGACTNPSVADLNKDCKVDLLDYDIFLREMVSRS